MWIVKKQTAGQRLDKALVAKYGQSRQHWQKTIKAGGALVNNRLGTNHYLLKLGDRVTVKQSKQLKSTKPLDLIKQIKVVAKTKDYLVLNKPAGLIVHPVAGQSSVYTLVDWLLAKRPAIKTVGEPGRSGIVHRLDKEVSGLMAVARTQKFYNNLKQQFQARAVYKEYQALVHGRIDQDQAILTFPINRSARGKMVARPQGQSGKSALTVIHVKHRLTNFTLLKVIIKTGRTHQIRVHLLAFNHPVVGDRLYSNKLGKKQNIKLGLPRLFLAATKLEFNDLSGVRQKFSIGLPSELRAVLGKIK